MAEYYASSFPTGRLKIKLPPKPDAITLDLHIDVPWMVTRHGLTSLQKSPFKVDFPRMISGGLNSAIFALYLSDAMQEDEGDEMSRELIEDQIYFLNQQRYVALCRRLSQVATAKLNGQTASFIGLEGGRLIQNSLTRLAELSQAGIVYLTLTHNYNTDWADSATDTPRHKGLTEFGRSVVKECEKLKVLVDVSHTSIDTTKAVLSMTSKPVIASHSGVRALIDHPRNLDDDLIKAIAETGGLIGIPFARKFVGAPQSSVVEHIDHIAQLVGPKHVAIGSDLDGAAMVDGVTDVSNWLYTATAGLAGRGYSLEDIQNISGMNMFRVMESLYG